MSSVSVIIPTYYRNDLLYRAIDSALSQVHPPEEVIIVDDSGEGHAASVVSDYNDDPIIYKKMDENVGAQRARECGVDLASGDYIQFLDDDDELHSTKFERQLDVISTTNNKVVYSGLKLENGDTVLPKSHVRGDVFEEALSLATWPCCIGTMLIDTELYEEIRPIKNKAEDHRMEIELSRRSPFDYVNEPLITIGIKTDTSLAGSEWQLKGLEELLNDYHTLYKQHPEAYQQAKGQVATNRARYTRKTVFEDKLWSWCAVHESFRAAWLDQEAPKKRYLIAIATLGGKLGLKIGEQLYRKLQT